MSPTAEHSIRVRRATRTKLEALKRETGFRMVDIVESLVEEATPRGLIEIRIRKLGSTEHLANDPALSGAA